MTAEPSHPYRTCVVCGETKPQKAFCRSKHRKHGYTNRCKECQKGMSKKHYRRSVGDREVRPCASPMTDEQWHEALRSGSMTCSICGEIRSIDEFATRRLLKGERPHRACDSCRAEWNRQWIERNDFRYRRKMREKCCRRLGISIETFDDLLVKQNGHCAVCGRRLGKKGINIDHDHDSGRVRGLVHKHCNLLLGVAHEDIITLAGAINYLAFHHSEKVWRVMRQSIISSPTEENAA